MGQDVNTQLSKKYDQREKESMGVIVQASITLTTAPSLPPLDPTASAHARAASSASFIFCNSSGDRCEGIAGLASTMKVPWIGSTCITVLSGMSSSIGANLSS